MTSTAPVKVTARVRSNASGVTSVNARRPSPRRTTRARRVRRAHARRAQRPARPLRSAGTTIARAPACRAAAAATSTPLRERATRATSAPSATNASTAARPRPLLAPVISTRRRAALIAHRQRLDRCPSIGRTRRRVRDAPCPPRRPRRHASTWSFRSRDGRRSTGRVPVAEAPDGQRCAPAAAGPCAERRPGRPHARDRRATDGARSAPLLPAHARLWQPATVGAECRWPLGT